MSLLRRAARSSAASSPEDRYESAQELHESLLLATAESGGLGSIVPSIISSMAACSGAHDLDPQTVSLCVGNLLQILDIEPAMRRQLAVPTALAVLRRCLAMVIDEDGMSRYVKLLHKIAEAHPQSVLRSGILQTPVVDWMDSGVLMVEDKRIVYATLLKCVEGAYGREDAALLLDLCPRLVAIIKDAYNFKCAVAHLNDAIDGTVGDGGDSSRDSHGHDAGGGRWAPQYMSVSSPSSSAVGLATGSAPSSTTTTIHVEKCAFSSDAASLDFACRMTSRMVSIAAGNAQGHWNYWAAEYAQAMSSNLRIHHHDPVPALAGGNGRVGGHGGGAVDASSSQKRQPGSDALADGNATAGAPQQQQAQAQPQPHRDPVPSNWPLQVLLHLCAMGLPQAWARALAGHCAAIAPGRSDSGSSSGGSSCGDGVGASSPSAAIPTVVITGTGCPLSRYTLKAVIRALARLLTVLRTNDSFVAARGSTPSQAAKQATSSSSSSSSAATAASTITFPALMADLNAKHGLAATLQRLMSIAAATDLTKPQTSDELVAPIMSAAVASSPPATGTGPQASRPVDSSLSDAAADAPTTATAHARSTPSPAADTAAAQLPLRLDHVPHEGEILEDCLLLAAAMMLG